MMESVILVLIIVLIWAFALRFKVSKLQEEITYKVVKDDLVISLREAFEKLHVADPECPQTERELRGFYSINTTLQLAAHDKTICQADLFGWDVRFTNYLLDHTKDNIDKLQTFLDKLEVKLQK